MLLRSNHSIRLAVIVSTLALLPLGLVSSGQVRADTPTGELGRVKCPTLVIGGEADIFTPPWMAREVAQAIPGAELHLYPEAGHAFHWEEIDDFNPRVRDWLRAH